jgi:hypothetical protein
MPRGVATIEERTWFDAEDWMRKILYLRLSGCVFGLVAGLHLARLALGWQAQIGSWTVPFWLSWGGLFGAAALSVWAFLLASAE